MPTIGNKQNRPYFKLSQRHSQGQLGPRAASAAQPYTVPALCAAYNWPSGLAGGGVIAIVELNGGWVQSDVDSFFQSIGQPSPQITDVSVDTTTNNPNQYLGQQDDPDYEVALDIQVAGASYYVATGQAATIRVYWSADIASAVQQAATDGCDVCSISWGSDEANWIASDPNSPATMEAAATAATAAGMIVFAASGDNDSSDGGSTPANVDLPSSCPHIIACGGTSKTATTETVWNNNPGETDGEGTGGGYSTIFPIQPWQAGAPNGPGRMVPDVAADADPNTGYIVWTHGQQVSGEGGTSAVAPLYAGLFASFGTKLGWVAPRLWANQLCFNDITQGDNGFYRAAPGPDPCTGLGSPIGTKLAALLVGTQATPVTSSSVAPSALSRPTVTGKGPGGSRSYLRRKP